MTIRAVLLDSGRVLNYPASGHWFVPPEFFTVADPQVFRHIPKRRRDNAFRASGKCLQETLYVPDTEAEYRLFCTYYQRLAEQLPELGLTDLHTRKLARLMVFRPEKYTFYEDAAALLPEWNRRYQVGVVSDAWPSLATVFSHAGHARHLGTLVISSCLGTCKPDPAMYRTALARLGVPPEEAVFVDDAPVNVRGALDTGISRGFLLCRSLKEWTYAMVRYRQLNPVRSLWDVQQWLENNRNKSNNHGV